VFHGTAEWTLLTEIRCVVGRVLDSASELHEGRLEKLAGYRRQPKVRTGVFTILRRVLNI
jgi:hypothetical protein